MTRDWTKLDTVMDYLEAHPEEWNQQIWGLDGDDPDTEPTVCGTSCCVAGRTVLMEGYVPVWKWNNDFDRWGFSDVRSEGSIYSVSGTAQRELGLTDPEADLLFWDTRDIVDFAFMRWLVTMIKEGVVTRYDIFPFLHAEYVNEGHSDPEREH